MLAGHSERVRHMETVGLGLYFEDLPVGRRFKTIGRTVTEADITNFVNCTGMVEVLFTNTEFLARESDIKGRLAPGALVYCFAEGLLVQATMQHTGFAFLHMELTVENPVLAGDTIHAECEIVEARRSKSRPGRGIVRALLPERVEHLAADFDRLRGDQHEGDDARLGAVVDPVMDRAALHDDVAGLQMRDLAGLELHVDLALHDDGV